MSNANNTPTMEFEKGDIKENWRGFKQHFEIFMVASGNDKKTETIKIVITLNTLRKYGIKIYNEISPLPEKMETLLTKFTEHFTPKLNITYEQYIFNTPNKIENEITEDYITELQRLAGTCNLSLKNVIDS